MRDLHLAIDVGTGGLRAALVDPDKHILAFSHKEHEQIVPRCGRSEQRPEDWGQGPLATIAGDQVVGEGLQFLRSTSEQYGLIERRHLS